MNKNQFLKIAKVKTLNEFYSKFPDEESFMKAHGKEFKKAMRGSKIQKAQGGIKTPPKQSDYNDYNDYMAAMDAYNQSLYTSPIPAIKEVGKIEPVGTEGPQLIPSQANLAQQKLNWGTPNEITGANQFSKSQFDPMSALPIIGGVLGAIPKIKAQQLAIRKAKQAAKMTDLQATLAGMTEMPLKNQYSRPEDFITSGTEVYPYTTGSPYEILKAQDGVMLNQVTGGIPGEIANTFAPGDIYNDMGYEPLDESDRLKQFQTGGGIGEGLNKFSNLWDKTGLNPASFASLLGGTGYQRGGFGDIGTGVANILPKVLTGKAAGLAGPIGMAAGFVGGAIDSAMKHKEQGYLNQAEKNTARMFGSQVGGALRMAHPGVFEDGGQVSDYEWVSHTWQPQVITQFGEHKLSDLLQPPHDADMLRAGGHLKAYTPPSEKAMQTFDMGGELQVDGRGDIDFMGYNPVTASTGANGYIGISRGPSHDNGGFNMNYNGNTVEIEGGETIMEKQDGGNVGDTALNVLGNLKMGVLAGHILDGINPSVAKSLLKGRNPKDVKFKHIGNDIAKKTKSLNNLQNKYIDLANSADSSSKFGKLELETAKAALKGINSQYEELNNLQDNLVARQAAINNVSERLGINADKFAATGKAEIDPKAMKESQAKYGKGIPKAQNGWWEDAPLGRFLSNMYQALYVPKEVREGLERAAKQKLANMPKVDISKLPGFVNPNQPKTILPSFVTVPAPVVTPTVTPTISSNASNTSNATIPTVSLDLSENAGQQKYETLAERFENTKKDALESLKSLYPGKKVEIKEASGDRDITTQRGLHASGASKTDVSIHNLGGAKDLVIYVDGKLVTDNNVYKNTTHAAAKKHGLYSLNWKEDPYHISAVQEGKGDTYNQLVTRFPEVKNTKTYKNTISYLQNNASKNQLTKSELNAYRQLVDKDVSKFTPYSFDYQSIAGNYPKMEWEDVNIPTISTTDTTQKKDELPKIGGGEPGKKPSTPIQPTVVPYQNNVLSSILGQVAPYLRRDIYPGLDWRQLVGEAETMREQPEGVKAQLPQPILRQPYTVSFQDRLNEITAGTNAALKSTAGNPAAQASILAESRRAKDAVLADQFRTNQQIFSGISGENLAELRNVRDKQLGILDTQAFRQSTAKSLTKAMKREALQSLADKELQHELEINKYAAARNLFPNIYFDPRFKTVASGYNQFNIPTVYTGPDGKKYTLATPGQMGTPTQQPSLSTPGIVGQQLIPLEEQQDIEQSYLPVHKKGGKIKKNNLNSSIVKALKNL